MMQEQLSIDTSNPILDGHRIDGRAVLPGLAYIDLLYQLCRDRGMDFRRLELRDLTIYQPLALNDDDEVLLTVRWEPETAGVERVYVEGRPRSGGAAGGVRYASARLRQVPPVSFDERLTESSTAHAAEAPVNLSDVYAQCARLGLVQRGLMKAEGRILKVEGQALVEVSLGPDAAGSAPDYMFHPALIDGSGVGSASLFAALFQEDEQLYLPLYYESFRACELIQRDCVARIKTSSVRRQNELVTVTIDFFDASGRKVAELSNVSCKRVRRPAEASAVTGQHPPARTGSADFEEYLTELFAVRLGIHANQLDPGAGFYELGMDSRGLLEVIETVGSDLGVSLPPTLPFEYHNIEELAGHLAARYAVRAPAQATRVNDEGVRPGAQTQEVAIIGVAGRYPGAADVRELWENLKRGVNSITEVPAERWRWQDYTGINSPSGKPVSKWGGFVKDPDRFDARFFRVTPREAEVMDPQERLFLETCWTAVEDAGYTPETLTGPEGPNRRHPVGVFVGVMQKDYALLQAEAVASGTPLPLSLNYAPIANRVSYFCNFHGPSVAVDTACSSSLMAVHLALQSLAQGECALALAGGVNLSLHPDKYVSCGLMDMHSSDGQCRAFGDGGDGYVSSEGVGAIVLKPLAAAVADGDHVYAVIKASACNHVGTVGGITVPSPVAQADMIANCLRKAHVHPRTISYVEAHGTGTSLGDPIEIEGLARAYGEQTADRQFCAIGSVKSNIGHAESAAGISGLTKALLQLHHRTLVPSLHAEQLNAHIAFAETPFYVQRQTAPWERPVVQEGGRRVVYPRRAAVSSFGASGTNCHVILEEFEAAGTGARETGAVVVPLSAMSEEQLTEYARRLRDEVRRRVPAADAAPEPFEATLTRMLAESVYVSADALDAYAEWSEFGVEASHLDALERRLCDWLELPALGVKLSPQLSVAELAARLRRAHPAHFAATREANAASQSPEEFTLSDVAYTLQVGRRPLAERVAFVASDWAELVGKLTDFIDGRDAAGRFQRGRVERGARAVDASFGVEALARTSAPEELDEWAARWVQGRPVEWQTLHAGRERRRVSLPTYPFARTRFWVPQPDAARALAAVSDAPAAEAAPLTSAKTLAVAKLTSMLSNVTKIPAEQLEADVPFEELGLDSLMITALNQQVEKWVGALDATLFFKYKSIDALAGHLVEQHAPTIARASEAAPTRPTPTDSSNAPGSGGEPSAVTPRRVSATVYEGDIAIIGLSGRYPGGRDLEEFWQTLLEGRDCIEQIPADRWSLEGFYEPERAKALAANKSYSKWGGFLDAVDKFDPLFFQISPKEAMYMDPHERLFLEAAWECVEDAGYTRRALERDGGNRIGVFVGATFNNYQLFMSEAAQRAHATAYPASSQLFSVANRVSYFMNFTGPSLTVDTACSSSLVALHLACESIRRGESRLAVGGGVNLSLHPSKYVSLSLGQFMASDGRCRAFCEGGTGYVPGEGIGAVLLKPLADAVQDGDHIYGVVKGTGTSHGGRTNGYSVPNPAAQSQAIELALKQAGVAPRTITCVEAHGTGTALGDPVEIAGLTDVFRKYTSDTGFCAVSSVKSNIGHSEAAAGIAQLTKVLLQMKHRTLVRNVAHGAGANPNIDFSATPFFVQHETAFWERPTDGRHEFPRRAGISSFGAGGANAHVIVEEYVAEDEPAGSGLNGRPAVIVLSAKNEERLREQAERLAQHLRREDVGDDQLAAIAYTLQVGREPMEQRLAFTAHTVGEAEAKLRRFVAGEDAGEDFQRGEAKRNREAFALFAADEDLEQFLQVWLDKGKYSKLLQLWVNGLAFDWQRLYAGAPPRRVSLPTYPFARDRYWVPEFETKQAAGASVTPAPSAPTPSAEAAGVPAELFTYLPVWDAVPSVERGTLSPAAGERVLIVGGDERRQSDLRRLYREARTLEVSPADTVEEIAQKLAEQGAVEHLVWAVPEASPRDLSDGSAVEAQSRGVLLGFRLIKALLQLGYGAKSLGWTVITTQTQAVSDDDSIAPTHASIHGLVGPMAKEYPNWKVRLVDVGAGDEWPLAELFALPADPKGDAWVYRGGEWYRQRLIACALPAVGQSFYRPGGVYVVVGGAGGIGEVWSEYVIRTYGARVVWIGRRAKDAELEAKIARLAALGAAPHYIAADAADHGALERARAEIKALYGEIHGVVHSALILSDKSLANMDEERFRGGLSAKVDISVRLAQVFGREPLDFMLFFSSMQTFFKAPGQSNYASGCTFKDAFARWLSRHLSCRVRVVNWGYWGSVGVVASESYQERMAHMGVGSIEPEEAMGVLEGLLAGPLGQVAFIKLTRAEVAPGMGLDASVLVSTLPRAAVSVSERLAAVRAQAPPMQAISAIGEENLQALNRLLVELLRGQLQSLGLFEEPRLPLARWKAAVKLPALYERWLEESLSVLVAHGHLRREADAYVVARPARVETAAVWAEWESAKAEWVQDSNLKAQVTLVETTLRALPDILTGRRPVTDVIFPNSSMELVEGTYKNNLVSDYFNEVLADTIVAYLEERRRVEPAVRVRLLEIGAGTGGTSAIVLKKLEPYRDQIEEYCYTDISKAFLMHAEREYGPANPYLTYRLFNVEAPPAAQSIEAGSYDLAIATNVLHATRNIRATLRNAKAVLRRNGLLLVNEMSDKNLFVHLTFGLLEGWWLYEDIAVRIPGSPGLYPDTWRAVLHAEGFNSVFFPARESHDLGQQIVVAESDGLVRQPRELPAARPARGQGKAKATPATGSRPSAAPPREAARAGAGVTEQMVAEHVRQTIVEQLSESLKVEAEDVELDGSFADYGVDSITGVQLVQLINQHLGLELTTTSLFDYTSVEKLTGHILSEHGAAISAVLGAAVEEVSGSAAVPTAAEPREPARAAVSVEPPQESERVGEQVRVESASRSASPEPIAIIGLSGRYPQSANVEELWRHLAQGDDLIEPVTRWDSAEWNPQGDDCRHGGFLDEIDRFDPLFFNISGTEATYMDPQQRLFLEESWKALEDAGYAGSNIDARRCGVYVGYNRGDYYVLLPDDAPAQAMWGNAASIISARIAYYLNLQGPAITIDSACSSSLVAMHLACQALWAGETEMALAGGVFVQCTPGFYVSANRARMLSPSGRCHTFDARADGFVPGEGVGVVVLKRLRDALADGDHVYGVIRASGINQDGTTNGITAPSALSQERLEREVYETFNVHPDEVQMVEAHGTGTRLGDPIEYQALTKAFRRYTDRQEFCAIGSIKTNIGHTTAAAGVAGLTKILLSFRHRQMPPTLHYLSGNPDIQFKGSPFYVNTRLHDWEPGPRGRRSAAISSFGFSGTNAHMVLEDAPAAARSHAERPGYLVVLSARTAEQLRRQVEQLVAHCERTPDLDCGNVSFTLLVGRRHFNQRLACIVRNESELVGLLRKWLEKGKAPQVYVSALPETEYREQVSLKRYGNQCIEECRVEREASEYLERLSAIAELYGQGYALNFEQLFAADSYTRVPLPTYPFARERYWVAETTKSSGVVAHASRVAPSAVLHPLAQRNTSSLSTQRFSSTFDGEEFFLSHHIVRGRRVLPGVAYLEMARAALQESLEIPAREMRAGLRLRDIVWSRPLSVGAHPVEVHIELSPDEGGEVSFDVYTAGEDGASVEAVIHTQGRAALLDPPQSVPAHDLDALRRACTHRTLSAEQCYEAFRGVGLDYGAAHQAIELVYTGKEADGRPQTLARLRLPGVVAETRASYVLHPSLLDAALQASIGLMDDADAEGATGAAPKTLVPFSLAQLDLFDACPAEPWVLLRYSEDGGPGKRVRKLDVDLCDEQGRVCVRLKGFVSRVLERDAVEEAVRTLMFAPRWEARPPVEAVTGETAGDVVERLLVLCAPAEGTGDDLFERYASHVEASLPGARCLLLRAREVDAARRFESYGVELLDAVRRLLMNGSHAETLLQVLVESEGEESLLFGLAGILRSARLENPRLQAQIIGIERDEAPEALLRKLRENGRDHAADAIRYERGVRQVAAWAELGSAPATEETIVWREGGVYLITGGAGGLGLLFAQEAARAAHGVALVLTGRSALNAELEAKLEELRALGARVEYRQVDVTSEPAVQALLADIRARHGRLDGILHSAGVIRDSFIVKKSAEELRAVLAPKVAGLLNLDHASRDLRLDFFVLFSSLAGALGNVGQADYAAANAFMDAYAHYRDGLVREGWRHGRTLAVNWPLWTGGGMRVDAQTERLMREGGTVPLGVEDGMRALARGLASGERQVLVLHGEPNRLRAALSRRAALVGRHREATAVSLLEAAPAAVLPELLPERAVGYFRELLASDLRLPVERIQPNAPLENYGIDSVMVMQLTARLEQTFGPLSKTLFFEYQTIRELAGYFVAAFPAKMAELTEPPSAHAPQPVEPSSDVTAQRHLPRLVRPLARKAEAERAGASGEASAARALDIAIIGVAGRYPMANDLDTLWANLRDGKDCVTEIPDGRWDHGRLYHPEKGRRGKVYCKWGGFLDDVAGFDAAFFHISPREAQIMDPQERLFMECVYETLEDAGYTRDTVGRERNVGVYVGVMYEEYQFYGVERTLEGVPLALAGNPSSIANRVSYHFNFHGPSMAVDTMCSSSLTAIHLACQSLAQGECSAAIAGGVNVSIHPNKFVILSQGRFASTKGRCESFGEGGDGYVPAEGVGAVLLKPLAEAERDGDHIYGVIRGTAVNHGGKTNGYTVPNPNAQAAVIARALEKAGIEARTVSYVEAHGTGTSLGDPIEITGLSKAFRVGTDARQFCAIGSIKSNIGHAESAAGVAGLTKALLQMKHRQLVPSLHAKTLNSNIDFGQTPFVVQRELAPWQRPVIADADGREREVLRRAGISSFGAGGANAHVIVEEYEAPAAPAEVGPFVCVLSAKKADRLRMRAERLLQTLGSGEFDEGQLAAIAYTLQVGREAMEERLAIVTNTLGELTRALAAFVRGVETNAHRGRAAERIERESVPPEALRQWATTGAYDRIAEAWAGGLDVDWRLLYPQGTPARVPLPAYPFAHVRYWVPERPQTDAPSNGQSAQAAGEPQPRPEPAVQTVPADAARTSPPASTGPKPRGISLGTPQSVPSGPDSPSTKPRQHVRLEPLAEDTHAAAPPPETVPAVARVSEEVGSQPAPLETVLEAVRPELLNSLAEALLMEPSEIDETRPFVELGLDSIIGVEWVNSINTRFGTSINATRVYDFTTLEEFTRYVSELVAAATPSANGSGRLTAGVEPAQMTEAESTVSVAPAADEAALDVLQGELAVSLADALLTQPEEIGLDTPFVELGLDSIIGVEWVQEVNRRYGTSINATKIYDHPSLREFSRFVAQRLAGDAPSQTEGTPVMTGGDPLDDLLLRVYNGELEVERAEELLQRLRS